MTDTDKLKRLAEAQVGFDVAVQSVKTAFDFISAASPEAILALIAENERLKEKLNIEQMWSVRMERQRDEAVALLLELMTLKMDWYWDQSTHDKITTFLARIDGDA